MPYLLSSSPERNVGIFPFFKRVFRRTDVRKEIEHHLSIVFSFKGTGTTVNTWEYAMVSAFRLLTANNLQLDSLWKLYMPLVKNLSLQKNSAVSKGKMDILFIFFFFVCDLSTACIRVAVKPL